MPFDYMMHLLEQVAAKKTHIEQLLPWRFAKD
ncbi:hypothetical protein KJ365_12500 [Glaciecola sp. XM2]|nr:hypothetical protein [Glaciecola sp. XM2]